MCKICSRNDFIQPNGHLTKCEIIISEINCLPAQKVSCWLCIMSKFKFDISMLPRAAKEDCCSECESNIDTDTDIQCIVCGVYQHKECLLNSGRYMRKFINYCARSESPYAWVCVACIQLWAEGISIKKEAEKVLVSRTSMINDFAGELHRCKRTLALQLEDGSKLKGVIQQKDILMEKLEKELESACEAKKNIECQIEGLNEEHTKRMEALENEISQIKESNHQLKSSFKPLEANDDQSMPMREHGKSSCSSTSSRSPPSRYGGSSSRSYGGPRGSASQHSYLNNISTEPVEVKITNIRNKLDNAELASTLKDIVGENELFFVGRQYTISLTDKCYRSVIVRCSSYAALMLTSMKSLLKDKETLVFYPFSSVHAYNRKLQISEEKIYSSIQM